MASIIMYIVSLCMTHSHELASVVKSEWLHQGSENADAGRSSAVFTIPRQQSKHVEFADILVQGLN